MIAEGRFFFFKQKTAYEIKECDWSSDVCSSDLCVPTAVVVHHEGKSSAGPGSARLIVEFNRSAYRYYRKHYMASDFDPRNVVALCGLGMRTIALLIMHALKRVMKDARGR